MKEFAVKASADGLTLKGLIVEPQGAPRAIVQLVHGMCEHKERYVPFMEYLASNGFVCVIHDHRGHGASVKDGAGDLGYMYDGGWDALVEDIRVVNNYAKEAYPGLGLYLLGHSMGSLAVRCFVKKHDSLVDRLVVCGSPSHNPAAGAGILLAKAASFFCGSRCRPAMIHNIAFSAYNKPFASEGYSSAWVCSDKSVLDAYHSDPLCMYRFTANGFMNLFKGMRKCYSPAGWAMAKPDMPVFFISGADDPCMVNEKTYLEDVALMRKVGYRDVSFRIYPGMRHEILNETDRRQVWDDVLAFISKHDG